MVYHPFRSLGRYALAACVVGLSVLSLGAQTPGATAPVSGSNPSRVDVFAGYSYFGAHGKLQPAGIDYSSINVGAIGSGAYYINKFFGGEIVYANHTNSVGNPNDDVQSISVGPIVRLPLQNFTVFAHGLVGSERLGGPNTLTPAVAFEKEADNWGVALTVGGGADYALPFFDNRFSLRLFQADYRFMHDDYGPYLGIPTTGGSVGGRVNLNAVEVSTGIVAHFGHVIPPPPVTYSCSVAPSSIFQGDPVTATGTALNLNPKKKTTYTWTSDSGAVSSTSNVANVDTKTLAPGTYTVKGHVAEGAKPGQMADCSGSFTVKPFDPPTISCSANPSSVNPGDSSTITASAVSPQNRPLSYNYNATAGSISGTTSSATLATAGAAPGLITVSCNVVDDKGHSVSATTGVTVIAPPPPPVVIPQASSLCPVSFERDAKRPTRVDNEAKACLDDIALNLQRSTDAKLALVGNATVKENVVKGKGKKKSKARELAAQRAVNTKDYLVTDKGIDASRIQVYTGTDDGKTVTSTLIPSGATNPVASDAAVDENAVKAVPRNPVKKTVKKAAAKK